MIGFRSCALGISVPEVIVRSSGNTQFHFVLWLVIINFGHLIMVVLTRLLHCEVTHSVINKCLVGRYFKTVLKFIHLKSFIYIFLTVWTHGLHCTQWIIICNYRLFWCSNCLWFDLFFWHVPILACWHDKMLYCPCFSPGINHFSKDQSLVSFNGKWSLKARVWAQGVLTASGISLFLRPLSSQS